MPQIFHLPQTDSTNNHLLRLMESGALQNGDVAVADFQTNGRGQRENQWESARAENLLFSILLMSSGLPANRQFIFSQAISLAIAETLDQYTECITIKWPNDILAGSRKIAGILMENLVEGDQLKRSIAGIGLNLNQTCFTAHMPRKPVSLKMLTGEHYRPDDVLQLLVPSILRYTALAGTGHFIQIEQGYRQRMYQPAAFADRDGVFKASIKDVLPSGILVLEDTEGQLRHYAFKEVEYL